MIPFLMKEMVTKKSDSTNKPSEENHAQSDMPEKLAEDIRAQLNKPKSISEDSHHAQAPWQKLNNKPVTNRGPKPNPGGNRILAIPKKLTDNITAQPDTSQNPQRQILLHHIARTVATLAMTKNLAEDEHTQVNNHKRPPESTHTLSPQDTLSNTLTSNEHTAISKVDEFVQYLENHGIEHRRYKEDDGCEWINIPNPKVEYKFSATDRRVIGKELFRHDCLTDHGVDCWFEKDKFTIQKIIMNVKNDKQDSLCSEIHAMGVWKIVYLQKRKELVAYYDIPYPSEQVPLSVIVQTLKTFVVCGSWNGKIILDICNNKYRGHYRGDKSVGMMCDEIWEM